MADGVPGAQWIAAISYSLYLSHKLAFHVVSVTWTPTLTENRALTFMIYAAAVLAFGTLLHYGVERPFLALRDRRGWRQQAASPQSEIAVQTA